MRAAIQWMSENHVASNILMLVFIIGGIMIGRTVKEEVFPEFELDRISVIIPFPGAGPAEVEDAIIQPLEHAVSGVDNIRRITANANEGTGSIIIEIVEGSDVDDVLDQVKTEVDRIRTLPEDAEDPIVSKLNTRREVMTLVVFGDVSERALYEYAERIRDDLLDKENITQADIVAVRAPEINVEISEENLRRYNLTLNRVASIIRRASLDMPGGSIKTAGGEILVRTNQKRYTGGELDSIAVIVRPGGERVLLGDIAVIKDAFTEVDQESNFDGLPAAMIRVFRVGDQTPKDISKTVNDYVAQMKEQLPYSVDIAVWKDRSEILTDRLNLLLRNGSIGIILVLISLALFLEIRLAFWVAMGMVIAFMGALLFMPALNVSINMISLFAFLVVLGVVVDDAIIIGENIYVHYRSGKPLKQAVVDGTMEVSKAVVFAVLTSIAAFAPLLFVSGTMGKFWSVIPLIVITVLLISLIESLFILPSHLNSRLVRSRAEIWIKIENQRSKFDRLVTWMIDKTYKNTLKWVEVNRYTTVAIAMLILLVTIGLIGGGYIKFTFMPHIESDNISLQLTMAPGTPFEETRRVAQMIENRGRELVAEYDKLRSDGESNFRHSFTSIGSQSARRMGHMGSGESTGSNLAQVRLLFTAADNRQVDLSEFSHEWRKKIGQVPGLESLSMRMQIVGAEADIDIQLAHEDYKVLLSAVERIKDALNGYAGVDEVNDSYSEGKRELKLRLRPEASSLGLTETDLALQVRGAFYGAEALRLQRGRNEIKVMVRYPEEDRRKLSTMKDMRFRTPDGGEVPFEQAAYVQESRGYSAIKRTDRKRVINITAKVDSRFANADELLDEMKQGLLAQLVIDYPGLSFDLEGTRRDRNESMSSLMSGYVMAIFVIFGLLAIPFRSFAQPLIVMSAIPFGIVGAVFGHLLLGYDLSIISMLGLVALAGIVVNDSLVMVDFINRARDAGVPIREAVLASGKRRFRPIILTSLTTFLGLTPMILETSRQARFLIPMAISLGFGVLFATAIILVLVPALYLILEDLKDYFGIKEEDTDRIPQNIEQQNLIDNT